MAKHDEVYVASLPMSGLIDGWPGKIKGELDRRTVACGYRSRAECVAAELEKERRGSVSLLKPLPLVTVAALPSPRGLTAADLRDLEWELIQSIRTSYIKSFKMDRKGVYPFAGDFRAPLEQQLIAPEARIYLDHPEAWVAGWRRDKRRPKDISMADAFTILEALAAGKGGKARRA